MGGLNSGRRPDLWEQRPQVEDALILDIPLLRSCNAFTSGAHGVMQWTEKRGCLVFHTCGDTITFDYSVKGQPYQQTIRVAAIPLKLSNGTSRPCLFCSVCQRRGYKLYLSRKPYFLCRACQGLVYVCRNLFTMEGGAMRTFKASSGFTKKNVGLKRGENATISRWHHERTFNGDKARSSSSGQN